MPPVVFAESAAYRTLKSDVVAFYEVDADENGYPDAFIFQKTDGGFEPVFYRQEPMEETTRWVRVCRGEPLVGERLERLRFIRDGETRRLLATASTEDPDRLTIDYAVFDPKQPCSPLLQQKRSFDKPPGDVLSPGPVRMGLSVAGDGTLLIVDSPATTRLRGVNHHLDVLTAVTVRQWQGSAPPADAEWREVRKSLLAEVEVELEWIPESAYAPDAIVSDSGLFDRTEPAPPSQATRASRRDDGTWTLPAGEVGMLVVRSDEPFVLLEVRYGCGQVESSTLELSSVDGPSLFVAGADPVENGVFLGSASGRKKPGEAAVELGALRAPSRSLRLKIGPVEQERCLQTLTAYGWTLPSEPAATAER